MGRKQRVKLYEERKIGVLEHIVDMGGSVDGYYKFGWNDAALMKRLGGKKVDFEYYFGSVAGQLEKTGEVYIHRYPSGLSKVQITEEGERKLALFRGEVRLLV